MGQFKILEVTAFSAGICGVWARVFAESKLLSARGYEVHVFSSNIFRGEGSKKTAKDFEIIEGIQIKRFPAKWSLGQNTFFWNYEKEAMKVKPNIIICHAYRQYYSTVALKIARMLDIPCILVTHAPFLDIKTRGWKLSLVSWIYDRFVGRKILNKYSKVFAISKWEIPYLLRLGVKKDKIIYVPNGIPREFFIIKSKRIKNPREKQILFLGRIAEIKDIETLVKAVEIVLKKDKNVILNLAGPVEEPYGNKLRLLIKELKIENNVNFLGPVYDVDKKIKLIDSNDILVLPSKREGMPQALIEAMSRSKIVIGSGIPSIKDLVQDGYSGFLFSKGDFDSLAKKILISLEENNKNRQIEKNARNSVKQFSWNILADKIEDVIKKESSI